MKNQWIAWLAAISGAGLMLAFSPAAAQASEENVEEVVVQAPMVYKQVIDVSESGVKTELIELRRRVSITDLDLTLAQDVNALNDRIEVVAQEACEKLDEMFPLGRERGDVARCVRKAIADAQGQVDQLVAAVH